MRSFHIIAFACLLLASSSAYSQKYEIAIGAGPSLLYVVEDAATEMDYFYGMSYYNDFIFLDENNLPEFGISLSSSSAEKSNKYYRYGLINNTSITASKYFSHKFLDFLTGNLEVGVGINYENLDAQFFYNDAINRYMLNLQVGGKLQAEILPNFFVHAKGQVVGQDVTNIIRYFSTGDWVTAGEDMHLLLFFGLATRFGSREE